MHSKTSTLSLLDHALPSTSTAQESRSLAHRRHLGHRHDAVGPGLMIVLSPFPSAGILTVYSWALQSSGCRILPFSLLVPNSSLASHPDGERDSLQVAVPLEYIAGESGGSSIGWNYYQGTQDHASNHITNHIATPPSPDPRSLPQLYAVGCSSRYPQGDGNSSTFGDLDRGSTGPSRGLGPIPPFHDHTSGHVVDSNATWSELSSWALFSLQDTHSSGVLTSDNVPPPPEQIQAEMAAPTPFCPDFTTQPMWQTHLLTPFPYARSTPFQSASTSYSTTDDATSCHTRPTDLPGFRRFSTASEMEPDSTGTVDNCAAHILGDHPLSTLSDHRAHPFGDRTYILDDHTAGMASGVVDDYGSFDTNSGQVVGSYSEVSQLVPSNSVISASEELYLPEYSSNSVPLLHEPHTSERLPHTNEGELAIPSKDTSYRPPFMEVLMARRNRIVLRLD
ncbi:hypothetical protein EDC04DRAFT_2613272 [Pisolithus marmoratus]|nr:hypothetical protein EDC04DRAFT_2613272 [Pisolithus marmoratus]